MNPDTEPLPSGGQRTAFRGLLGNRNFRNWFWSSLTSSLGDWMGFVALPLLVASFYEAGSRPALFALGGAMMVRLLPSAVFGPVAGVLADRYDRKRLIVATDLLRGALFIAVTFSNDLLAVFALIFVVECLSLLFMSARDASLPTIVRPDQLVTANQFNLLCAYGTLPLGAVASTAMIGLAAGVGGLVGRDVDPIRLALLVDALTYFVSAVMMLRVKIPHGRRGRAAEHEEGPGLLAELREGLNFIRTYPFVRALITGVVGAFFGAGIVIALGPELVRADFGRPSSDWSILLSAVGAGLVLGIVALVPLLLRRFTEEKVFPIALALTGGIGAAMGLLPSFEIALALGVVLGAAAGVTVVKGYTLLQAHTSDDVRARTFATFYTGTRIALFAALGFGPFVAGAIGRLTVGIAGVAFSLSGIRLTVVAGGLVAFWYGLRARKAMIAAGAAEPRPLRTSVKDSSRDRGIFVVFEGVEGSGKSTQVARLAETLRAEGRDVVVTREPGGSPLSERVRHILLDPNAEGIDDRTEALLYAAARAEHVRQVIGPALEVGKTVLCDRYVDSSLAYQGHARGLGAADVMELNRWAVEGVLPDVVVLLRLDPAEGLRRAAERARRNAVEKVRRVGQVAGQLFELPGVTEQLAADRLEREGIEFHRRVAEGYLELARKDRRRFVVVDAEGDADAIARQVRSGLHPWLPLPDAAAPDAGSPDSPTVKIPRRRGA